MSAPSASRIFLSGVILAGIPFIAIAQYWHIASQDARVAFPSELVTPVDTNNVGIMFELNSLDLAEVSGTDNIHPFDVVYVHMQPGPGLIAYPFGISKDKPKIDKNETAFSIRGTVISREGSVINLRYNFDAFFPTREMKPLLSPGQARHARVELAVNKQSIARLAAVELDGVRYPYRVMEKPVLKGLTQ